MISLLTRALGLWLALFELLAGLRGWRGLRWSAPAPPMMFVVSALALHPRGAGWPARIGALALTALPAALLQAALASWRNRALDPLADLAPGDHAGYRVERLDIALSEAHAPALLLEPRGGARAAVLVLHGSGCHKTYFAWRLARALLGRGLALLLIDLDGHGESPRPQRMAEATEPALGAAAFLRTRYGRVGLLGISLGGCIAARAAADGLALDALALLETPPLLSFTPPDRWREARELLRPFMIDLLGEATPRALAAAVVELVQAQRVPRIAAHVSTWELIAGLDLLGSLPRIAAPTLLVYGGRDAIVPPSQAEQARQAAPQAEFVMAPAASHLTMILHPATLELTAGWLSQTLNEKR